MNSGPLPSNTRKREQFSSAKRGAYGIPIAKKIFRFKGTYAQVYEPNNLHGATLHVNVCVKRTKQFYNYTKKVSVADLTTVCLTSCMMALSLVKSIVWYF